MKVVTKSLDLAGRTLSFEVGRLAPRTTSAVLASYGDATVLVSVALGKEDTKKDYFPLSVDYQERLYSGGRIKGSRWVKREGRPTDAETLSARLIDRSIRPLFPQNFKFEVQVIVTVLATDTINDTDVLALNATSAALAISPIPWAGPVAASRVGLEDGKLVVNPQNGNRTGADLDLVVTSSKDVIPMIEAGANQVPEDVIFSAFEAAHAANQQVIKLINNIVSEVGKDKLPVRDSKHDPELVSKVHAAAKDALVNALNPKVPFFDREHEFEQAKDSIALQFDDKQKTEVKEILDQLLQSSIRKDILEKKHRPDGRKPDEIRPLHIEVGVLPRVHGSAIFQRGETQALTITTLGAPSLSQSLESAEGEELKRYMHHYNMPPFATGETGRIGSPGRREIGHGALAERALAPVIPPETDFPYAIRVVSEILSSNGSTSMASTCGSTLSLMDAGVPIIAPVAGISIGLIQGDNSHVLLTDINGGEDHYGDMDFKIAGTESGITAIQLDVKIPGVTLEICKETLSRARTARTQILEAMLKVLPKVRPELSQYAPKISTVSIPVDKIGELIGPGGKNIKKLMADNAVTIDVNDNGSVFVSGVESEGVNRVLSYLQAMGKEVVVGEVYEGVVANIMPFGAFVNILPGRDGLVHVSQMASGFVSDPNTLVKMGQTVRVWVTDVDSTTGKIGLSMLFDEAGQPIVKPREERAPRSSGPFHAPRRFGDHGDRDRRPPRRF